MKLIYLTSNICRSYSIPPVAYLWSFCTIWPGPITLCFKFYAVQFHSKVFTLGQTRKLTWAVPKVAPQLKICLNHPTIYKYASLLVLCCIKSKFGPFGEHRNKTIIWILLLLKHKINSHLVDTFQQDG